MYQWELLLSFLRNRGVASINTLIAFKQKVSSLDQPAAQSCVIICLQMCVSSCPIFHSTLQKEVHCSLKNTFLLDSCLFFCHKFRNTFGVLFGLKDSEYHIYFIHMYYIFVYIIYILIYLY